MSQQPLDLRKSILIIRRLKAVVAIVAALGFLVGAAYAVLNPPGASGTAIVSLPASVRSTATEVVIASSYPVLSAAGNRVSPRVSAAQLSSEVQVKSLTAYLMSITVTAATATASEAIANAVAESYIAYVSNPRNPVESVDAEMFQPAVTATASPLLEAMLIAGLVGALGGAIAGSVVALAIGRRDRRLRDRDRIANSIGIPVLASVPVVHPADPSGWTSLLADYQPQAVHAWQLGTVLRYFGVTGQALAPSTGDEADRVAPGDDGMSLCVVSLSSDPGALALGPQLAVFAASQGIPTALVVGPQQDADATATLRTACTALLSSSGRPSSLQLVVTGDQDADQPEGTVLRIVVMVVDGRAPKMPATVRTAATVLGVSTGRVTAEQLARAALAAGANGHEVAGILVADPEPTDKTTGRVPQLIRPPRRRLPNRLKGVVTEGTR
jgi:capsular polysaccharide biosynthesis protein